MNLLQNHLNTSKLLPTSSRKALNGTPHHSLDPMLPLLSKRTWQDLGQWLVGLFFCKPIPPLQRVLKMPYSEQARSNGKLRKSSSHIAQMKRNSSSYGPHQDDDFSFPMTQAQGKSFKKNSKIFSNQCFYFQWSM